MRLRLPLLLLLCLLAFGVLTPNFGHAQDLSDQVIIRRTAYGVPHITADNMLAAGYALAYVQLEDYGKGTAEGLVRARGEWTQYHDLSGKDRSSSIDRDASQQIKIY